MSAASDFVRGSARGYVLGCRVGMPGVFVFGVARVLTGHPVQGVVIVLIGLLGTALAWATRLERLT